MMWCVAIYYGCGAILQFIASYYENGRDRPWANAVVIFLTLSSPLHRLFFLPLLLLHAPSLISSILLSPSHWQRCNLGHEIMFGT